MLCCCRGIRRGRWKDTRTEEKAHDHNNHTPGVIDEVTHRRDWDTQQQTEPPPVAESVAGYKFRVSCECPSDRSGAAHDTHRLTDTLANTLARDASTEMVGYAASKCYLKERVKCIAGASRGRVASDGDMLEGAARPQSGAFSESEVEWSGRTTHPPETAI